MIHNWDRAQHYKWTATAIFFMYLPGITLFVAKVRQFKLLGEEEEELRISNEFKDTQVSKRKAQENL